MRIIHLGRLLFFAFVLSFSTASFSQITDTALIQEVKKQLSEDGSLSEANIQISVHQNVVKLVGALESEDQALKAVELVQSLSGVRDVDTSELRVKESAQSLKDDLITAKIKGLLIQNKVFGDQDLGVVDLSIETVNGVVTLSGTLDSQLEVNRVLGLVTSVSGVKAVKLNIKLSLRTNSSAKSV